MSSTAVHLRTNQQDMNRSRSTGDEFKFMRESISSWLQLAKSLSQWPEPRKAAAPKWGVAGRQMLTYVLFWAMT